MANQLYLGAINRQTGKYVHPKLANKKDEYMCPECNKDLIVCQGDKISHHFRHKVDTINQCNHYSNPSESQIHKDAKNIMKTLLENKTPITFIRNCVCCKQNEEYEIPEISESSAIELEYRFDYNGQKIADVAYIENNQLLCIFEISNTHKTQSENRPEPWFEIDAATLISATNTDVSQIQIPCIRCEKCDDCIENEKNDILKKTQALDILYEWFKNGVEIPPFKYDYAKFHSVCKNAICFGIDEVFDLILHVNCDPKDNCDPEYTYERYCIRLVFDYSECYFTKENEYINSIKGLYYLDINWILSQSKIPTRIQFIASLDCYDHSQHEKTCTVHCKHLSPFWVKRIHTKNEYNVTHIQDCDYCDVYGSESIYGGCERCNSLAPLWVMETNKVSIHVCKACDIHLFSSGDIYLHVPFSGKDEAKKLGANWDSIHRKWFVNKYNTNIDIILEKWSRLW